MKFAILIPNLHSTCCIEKVWKDIASWAYVRKIWTSKENNNKRKCAKHVVVFCSFLGGGGGWVGGWD